MVRISSIRACALVLLGPLLGPSLHAQGVPFLVEDVNLEVGPPSWLESDGEALTVGSLTFFAGHASEGGIELWKTDGTAAGTALVLDIEPGSGSSNPRHFATMGGVLYFAATTVAFGRELWRSDGTVGGTYRVRDIATGVQNSNPESLTVVGGVLFFSAEHPSYGRELWKSDGTTLGTTLVVDARPGSSSSMSPNAEIAAGVRLVANVSFATVLFVANDGTHGAELWESNTFGTSMRADIRPGSGSSDPQELTSFSGHVMFSADDGTTGREPYYTRASGATQIGDVNSGFLSSSPQHFSAGSIGGSVKFYFAAFRLGVGSELWEYDTSASALTMVEDVNPGSPGSEPVPFVAGAVVLFSAETGRIGRELWITDGTSRGTLLVEDINPLGTSDPSDFFLLTSSPLRVLFRADNGTSGVEPWVTDGTASRTVLVENLNTVSSSTPVALALLPTGRALLSATPTANVPTYFVSNGTAASTDLLLPAAAGAASSNPRAFAGGDPGAPAWFAADDGVHGVEPWHSDGTPAGTQITRDVKAGSADGLFHTSTAIELDGRRIFMADDGISGLELWISDGTLAGTQLLKDINPGAGNSTPDGLTAMNGFALFFAYDPAHGKELWRTDGTALGTVLVEDIEPGPTSSLGTLPELGTRQDRFYFFAETAAYGLEPWISDGTATGTVLLKDISAGPSGSSQIFYNHFAASPTHVYFVADDNVHGFEIWRSTGTTASTQLVVDLSPGATSSTVLQLVWWSGLLYFRGATSSAMGLFSTNSSGSSAALVRSFPDIGLGNVGIGGLTDMGSKLLFAGYAPSSGWEPWISDGTNGGTVLLKEIRPGSDSGLPTQLHPFGFALFEGWFFRPPSAQVALFAAATAANGTELWRTDGTNAGTLMHADIAPGPTSSNPRQLTLAGDWLFFTAFQPVHGREPYAMEPPAMATSFRFGCPGTGGIAPTLSAFGAPSLGNANFQIALDRARASSAATLDVGFAPWYVPLGGGCSLHIDLLLPYVAFTLPTNTRGEAFFALPLPADPLLEGLDFFAQAFVVDPNGAFSRSLSFTAGLRAQLHSR